MSRNGSEAYKTETAFLEEEMALVDRELARRADDLSRDMPELAGEIRERVRTPVQDWSRPVSGQIVMSFRGLKVEQALIADLLSAIDARPLVECVERRIRALQQDEMQLIREEPGALYLRDAHYWNDEDALVVLNRPFRSWARWERGEPLEGP